MVTGIPNIAFSLLEKYDLTCIKKYKNITNGYPKKEAIFFILPYEKLMYCFFCRGLRVSV